MTDTVEFCKIKEGKDKGTLKLATSGSHHSNFNAIKWDKWIAAFDAGNRTRKIPEGHATVLLRCKNCWYVFSNLWDIKTAIYRSRKKKPRLPGPGGKGLASINKFFVAMRKAGPTLPTLVIAPRTTASAWPGALRS